MKVAILLLNRLGDYLQLLPTIKGFIDRGDDVTIIMNESIKPILEFIPKVKTLNNIDEYDKEGFDIAINYSSHEKAVDVFGKINAKKKIGFASTTAAIQTLEGRWMNYFLSVPYGRRLNKFNISDIFCKSSGIQTLVKGPYIECDKDTELINITDKPKIGLVIGASERNRIWWSSSWNSLIDRLNEKIDCDIYLLGSGESEEIEAEAIDARDNVYNLIGQTTLRELNIVVNNMDVIVGGDTGTLHLAAMSGIPVVGLYLGPAYVWATGPYGEGHYAIQPMVQCSPCQYNQYCGYEHCKECIDPEEVFICIMRLLDIEPESNPYLPNNVYYSRFNKELSSLEYVPEIDRRISLTIEDVLSFLAREAWTSVLTGWDMEVNWQERYNIPEDIRIFMEEAVQTFPLMAQCCSEGLNIIEQHIGDDNDVKSFLDTHNILAGINRRIFHLSRKSMTTCLSLQFFEIGVNMVSGATASELFDHYKYHYSIMREFLGKMYDKVFHFEVDNKCL